MGRADPDLAGATEEEVSARVGYSHFVGPIEDIWSPKPTLHCVGTGFPSIDWL